MSEELSKVYNPAEVEQKWYKFWEENDLFKPGSGGKGQGAGKTFTIVIPPPNVTGSLHMGHALNNSIQDLMIRYKRMCGFKTLWLPGTDHAGIATQNVVERELKKEGKSKDDLGREKFIAKVWEWKKEYGGKITQQLRRLGSSCDWSRERFTMDEGLTKAVRRHFVQLYKEGLIYRGKRIINWCPKDRTAISDIEVTHETKKGSLWFIKYGPITVATTRPETMLGDTAIAVNPKDERYKHMWGKTVELPLVGRKIPIIQDDFVDPSFGTGAVKVTPAHDPNDYDMGMRHNLPMINILTPDGKISLSEFSEEEKAKAEAEAKGIDGLDRFKARELLVKSLKEKGYLEKIEDYELSIGHCYRCNTIIEPYLSDQWFVKVKPLAEKAIAAVEEGQIKFVPERWTKVYLQWMTNLRDWCISRQLWWGHQIPAYYCKSEIRNSKYETNSKSEILNFKFCEEIIVSETKPEKCPKCGGTEIVQDPDVFDTWFSSALWPFSTLGWPDDTVDLKTFYPTDVLVTSYDIIFFWVARMIMAGLHFMKEVPFKAVYFNALVKDIHGKKMSKSWGNVIDPLEVIDRAGADALRFAFLSLTTGQGQDVKLSEDKITEGRNFANKIWNMARFVMLQEVTGGYGKLQEVAGLELADRWILSRLNQTIKQVTKNIDNYEFGEAAQALYSFIWSEFCDWYVEIAKIRLYGQDEKAKAEVLSILRSVLENTLKLLHPFMPFITEEIYQKLNPKSEILNPKQILNSKFESIMVQPWPKADEELIDPRADEGMADLMSVVGAIRNIRAEFNVSHGSEIEVALVSTNTFDESYIKSLVKVGNLKIVAKLDQKPKQSASAVVEGAEIYVVLAGLIDLEKEKLRLNKDKEKLEAELVKIKNRLADQNFLSRANPESVMKEREREKEFSAKLELLADRLNNLV